MNKIILVALATISLVAQAQKAPIKYGDIPMNDLKMSRYEKDTAAAGVVLMDYGESRMDYDHSNGFMVRFDRIRRIKIFKKDAYSFAEFNIPIYHNNERSEKITSLKAVSYNLEGGKMVETKMKSEGTFNEKINDNWNQVKFTLPNVKEGTILEIAYTIYSEFIFNFQDWEFQSTIPTIWSEYRAHIPEYFEYQKTMIGYIQPTIAEVKQASDVIQFTTKETTTGRLAQTTFDSDQLGFMRNDFRWVAQDVPAFKAEPRMNNTVDYISKINFELIFQQLPGGKERNYMGTWEGLNKEFLENARFGWEIAGAGFLKDITNSEIAGITEVGDKVGKIFNYVKTNVEWNGNYRLYITENLKKVVNDKKGSSADINLLLVSMLMKAGIAADPVLISTRNHGFIRKQVPSSNQFNYVICAVTLGDKVVFLDATDRSLPMNVLPERCLNGEGLIISEKFSRWIPITPSFKSRTISNFELALSDNGEMAGNVLISRDGYDAQKMRAEYLKKGEETYVNELASSRQWELQKSKFENTKELSQTVKESYEVKIPEQIQQSGNVMYLNPFVSGRLEENPFKSETRTYPVDFGSPTEQLIMGKFQIPQGYVVEELPKPKVFMLPKAGAKYVYNLSQVGDKIQFTSQLNINQSIFTVEEYNSLREFYNQVVAKQNEQIVIKKQ